MKRTLLAALAITLALAAPALAETPEEAVAYAFLGLADAATLTRSATHLTWHETSISPAVFEGHGEGQKGAYDVTFSVTKLSDCDYEIYLAGSPAMVRGGRTLYARIALADITGLVAGEFKVTIEGNGFCQTGQMNPNCTRVHETDIFGTLDGAKHARLVGELRTEVCVGPD